MKCEDGTCAKRSHDNPLGPCVGFPICLDKSDLSFCENSLNSSDHGIIETYECNNGSCILCKNNPNSKHSYQQCTSHLFFEKRDIDVQSKYNFKYIDSKTTLPF